METSKSYKIVKSDDLFKDEFQLLFCVPDGYINLGQFASFHEAYCSYQFHAQTMPASVLVCLNFELF